MPGLYHFALYINVLSMTVSGGASSLFEDFLSEAQSGPSAW